MSVTNDDELRQALGAIETLQLALSALKRDVPSTRNYAVLAEGTVDEIARLQAEVNEYLGVDDVRAELWMRVTGPTLDEPDAPSGVLTAVLDAFRKGLQAGTEHAHLGTLSTRPTAEIQRAVDIRVASLREGSLRIGINLNVPEQRDLEGVPGLRTAVERTLDEYLVTAAWAADESASDDVLTAAIPDTARRRVLLHAVLAMAPRTRGAIDSIEVTGRLVGQRPPIVLRRSSKNRIAGAIDRTETGVVEQHAGMLREIDLDHRTAIVRRTNAADIPCALSEELMSTAHEALGRSVRVYGERPDRAGRRSTTLFVTRLEILDDEAG